MSLLKSISGIRGTIGGKPGAGLTPPDIVKFAAAYGAWIISKKGKRVVLGRDARISGPVVNQLVTATLQSMGLDVTDIGLSTTPTVEIAVPFEKAAGGIILTASHNPQEWNALKLLNEKGEFISDEEGKNIIRLAESNDFSFADVLRLGKVRTKKKYIKKHIELICAHPYVDLRAIKKARFKIAVDAVNSSGGIAVPQLLKKLGVSKTIALFCEPTGHFPHNPEPLPEHLKTISETVKKKKCDLGIVVDPDVDRLALIMENGVPFNEEYTLVAVSDYVLSRKKGNTVSNLSSTRALRDVTEKHGGKYAAAAVGEVNVVARMKETQAVIGGEGNGGVIFPDLHYGRDALMGIALFLSHLARQKTTMTQLRQTYPAYHISKNKIELTADADIDAVLQQVSKKFEKEKVNRADGVKIDFEEAKEWVHLRKSNTEPVIRLYAEAATKERADELARQIMNEIKG